MTPDGLPDRQTFKDPCGMGLKADWESESARLYGMLCEVEILSDRKTVLLRFERFNGKEGYEMVATLHGVASTPDLRRT